jgi:hypothetical protein
MLARLRIARSIYEEDGEGLGAVRGISAQAEYSERRTPIMMKSFQPSG